jgi:hypothetical protein
MIITAKHTVLLIVASRCRSAVDDVGSNNSALWRPTAERNGALCPFSGWQRYSAAKNRTGATPARTYQPAARDEVPRRPVLTGVLRVLPGVL